MKSILYASAFVTILMLNACMKGEKVDLVVHNAQIHTMDNENHIYEAMAIKDGIIVEIGPERQILNKYRSDEDFDAKGQEIYPGFTDAHGHLFSYARQKLGVDLLSSKSWNEVLIRVQKYSESQNSKWIIGRGWDQSKWAVDSMPTNELLNERFPDIAVALYRIDGHAILVNDQLLSKCNLINKQGVYLEGVQLKEGKPTGLLIDRAMSLVEPFLMDYSQTQIKQTLKNIQKELLQYGITEVHEAGLTPKDLKLLMAMNRDKSLLIQVYGMLLCTPENKEFALKQGIYKNNKLSIRSFKLYADGALGSRGALLKRPYKDEPKSSGYLLNTPEEIKSWINFSLKVGYQLNTHAIGDSANHLILKAYEQAYKVRKDHRWRIEHAQVISPSDFHFFSDYSIFPSVQPTHSTTDQAWAVNRIGEERMNGAYAYQTLLQRFGMLALGTDFPVENVNPFNTILSAVEQKGTNKQSSAHLNSEESLTLEQALRGMTIWPQFASFSESERGSLEKGKQATFFIPYKAIQAGSLTEENFSLYTYVRGVLLHAADALD